MTGRNQYPEVTAEQREKAVAFYQSGKSQEEAARLAGCSPALVGKLVRKAGVARRPGVYRKQWRPFG